MKLLQNTQTFHNALDLKKNGFGWLRLFFALLVVYHHTFPLGGFGSEPIAVLLNHQEDIGTIAVASFFIISGFLVTHSYLHSKNLFSYGLKRFLRIYPAFCVCLIVTAFLFAPLVALGEGYTLSQLITTKDGSLDYIRHNLFIFMHQYDIVHLLSENPFPKVFDGSLWTLILEVKAYIVLGILGCIGIIQKRWMMLILFVLLYLLFASGIHFPEPSNKFFRFFIDNSVLHFLMYFISGSIFYLYRHRIPFHTLLFVTSLLLLPVFALFGILHVTLPFILCYMIFYLAAIFPFSSLEKSGDFSYGVYIYAFPIQQLLTYFGVASSYWLYLFFSVVLSLIAAFVSWHMIEKPTLMLKKSLLFQKITNYPFLTRFRRPLVVPSRTAKSATNWRRGKQKKARMSRT